jgi:hypothetical protein
MPHTGGPLGLKSLINYYIRRPLPASCFPPHPTQYTFLWGHLSQITDIYYTRSSQVVQITDWNRGFHSWVQVTCKTFFKSLSCMEIFKNVFILATSNLIMSNGSWTCMLCCADWLANPFARHLHSTLNPTNIYTVCFTNITQKSQSFVPVLVEAKCSQHYWVQEPTLLHHTYTVPRHQDEKQHQQLNQFFGQQDQSSTIIQPSLNIIHYH